MEINNFKRPTVEQPKQVDNNLPINRMEKIVTVPQDHTVALQDMQSYNKSGNFNNNEITSIKNSISEINILENNITIINEELMPLTNEIINSIENSPEEPKLSQLINEYSSRIETTNNGNKSLLNGNYDIPLNNTIKQVRVVSENSDLNNDKIIDTINTNKNSEKIFTNDIQEDIKKVEVFDNKAVNSYEETKKSNWQAHNINSKNINHSTFSEDNRNIEERTNEKREVSKNNVASIYNDEQPKIVFRTTNPEEMQSLRQHFYEQRERLENAARQHRTSIDVRVRLNEDMFATKNTITQIENNKLMQNTFSLSSIYSNLSSDTLNKMILF